MNAFSAPRCFALALVAVVASTAGAGATEAKETPPKEYVLFMGSDLSIERNKKLYRVEDVTGSEFKIRVDRQEVFVPTRNRELGLQIKHGLKLTETSVKLDQLESGPGYTPENDPARKLQSAMNATFSMSAYQDLAQASVARNESNRDDSARALAHSSNPEEVRNNQAALVVAQRDLNQSQGNLDSITSAMSSDLFSSGSGSKRMQTELAQEDFDAMEVSFKVSSPVELDSPYMVILFKFHARDAKPGVDGLVVHAEALDPIGAKPRYVRVLKGGLPIGFKYVDCAVHIYNRGVEVATNVSSKRVELTRDEARQYVVMEHLGANKGATAPAAAVPGSLSRTQRQHLTHEQLTRTIYAKVSKDGILLGTYSDEGCNVQLDDTATATVLGDIFFWPALADGKPVDGVARVRLASL